MKQTHTQTYELAGAESPKIGAGEVIIGSVVELDGQGQVLVTYHGNPAGEPLAAMTTLTITHAHIGRQAALLFADGDPRRPVIMGLIHSPLQAMLDDYELTPEQSEPVSQEAMAPAAKIDNVTVDGKRVLLEGKEEIILKCGEASITLTKAGKILIRGKYLLNRSEGVNRIMGGSVQVN